MLSVSIDDAQATLRELIRALPPGESLVITEDARPIAILSANGACNDKGPRRLGTMQGSVIYIAPDFDEPLEDFREYME